MEKARGLVAREGWLSKTPANFRNEILKKLLPRTLAKGDRLYTKEDKSSSMFCLISGSLRVWLNSAEDDLHFIHLISPVTWFGEGPLISGQPRLVNMTAASTSKLLCLSYHDINEILRRDPAAWKYIALLNLGHLDTAMHALTDLMMRDQTKRFIAVLLRLAGCRTEQNSGGCEIDANQAEIAAMANVARTTANLLLSKLHAAKLVGRDYNRVQILAPDKLRAMLVD